MYVPECQQKGMILDLEGAAKIFQRVGRPCELN